MEIEVDRIKGECMNDLVLSGMSILVVGVGMYVVVKVLCSGYRFYKESKSLAQTEKIIQLLEKSSPRLCYNKINDVVAVCTAYSRHQALDDHMQKIKNGEYNDWDKVVLYARPIFTFACSEQAQRPIHTGRIQDFEKIIDEIIHKVTGSKRKDLTDGERQDIVRTILVRDSRIFVPYSGNSVGGDKQLALFGKTTLEQAEVELNK